MKIQTNAVNILERTSSYLNSGVLTTVPAWYEVVARVPPRKKFTREPKLKDQKSMNGFRETVNGRGLFKTRANVRDKHVSTNSLYRSPKLVYLEDQLRELFYEQHPWERSRPKILVENNLERENSYDWNNIQQLGRPLDGESVVQRSLFLLKNDPTCGNNLISAYDQARFEFYRVRMKQEMEEQIAMEESQMFGSVFTTSTIDYGIEKEQQVIEDWKKKVIKETELISARRANPSESWGSEEATEDTAESAEDGSNGDEEVEVEELLF